MRVLSLACMVSLPWIAQSRDQDGSAAQESRAASRPARSSISGVVLWKGDAPKKKPNAALVVGDAGKLANAVVTLVPLEKQDLSAVPPPQLPVAEQAPPAQGDDAAAGRRIVFEDGAFRERVIVAGPEEPLVLQLEGGGPQRFTGKGGGRTFFTTHMGGGSFDLKRMLAGSGPFQITGPGDAVTWIVVTRDVYRVTGPSGSFRFEGLPPGRYRLEVWHESGKQKKEDLRVEPGTPARLEIELR